MLALTTPERLTCHSASVRYSLHRPQSLVFAALLGLAWGCGRAEDSSSTPLASITREGEESAVAGLHNGQNVLSFSSELKHFAQQDFQVGLSLGGRLLGGRVRADVVLRFTDASALNLKKTPRDADSRIFVDGSGRLDVRSNEEFTAQCEYATSASFTRGGDLQVSLAGVSVEAENGVMRLYEAGSLGERFPVQEGDTLNSLQAICEHRFDPETAAKLHADLQDALKSQVLVRMHGDRRVEAMRLLLMDLSTRLDDGEYSWKLTPPRVTRRDDQIVVRGEMVRDRWMFDQPFSYKFVFSADDALTVESAYLDPLDHSDVAFAAQRLATFIARNAAEWRLRSESGGEMVIQTKMLDKVPIR